MSRNSNDPAKIAQEKTLLFQLRRNGRLSNVELAQRVGLTPPPCLRRVKRLEDAGVIAGYRAVVDPAAVDRGLEVFVDVDINANDRNTVEAFETTAAGYDEVVELRRMFGHPDYFLRVAVADHAAYEAFLTGKLIGLPGMLRVTSHITMKTIKTED
jgi:DNA-binding Lrp family transcriptional regulator